MCGSPLASALQPADQLEKPGQAVPKATALAEAGSWPDQALPPRGQI